MLQEELHVPFTICGSRLDPNCPRIRRQEKDLTLIFRAGEPKEPFYFEQMMPEAKYYFLFEMKMQKKYRNKLLVSGVYNKKNVTCNVLLMIMHVQLTFLLSKASGRKHPPPHPPPVLCRGWGSTGSFQQQAVALVMVLKQ
jgi:hypothetical protein